MANEFEIINNPTSTPEAVSTGYQRQNTRAAASSNGIDNSFVEVTDQSAGEVTVQISGGVDVGGTLYAAKAPAVFTVSSAGRYYLYLADGADSTKKTVAIGTDNGDFDPELNARYLTSGERVLNWLIVKEAQGSENVTVLKMTDASRANGHNEPLLLMRTVISSSGSSTFVAPRSQVYTFELQACGGDGGDNYDDPGGSDFFNTGGGGGGGGYSKWSEYVKKGTTITLTKSTASAANCTLTGLDFTTVTAQNGTDGKDAGSVDLAAYEAPGGVGNTKNGQYGTGSDIEGFIGDFFTYPTGVSISTFLIRTRSMGRGGGSFYANPSAPVVLGNDGENYGGGGGGALGPGLASRTAGSGAPGLLLIWG